MSYIFFFHIDRCGSAGRSGFIRVSWMPYTDETLILSVTSRHHPLTISKRDGDSRCQSWCQTCLLAWEGNSGGNTTLTPFWARTQQFGLDDDFLVLLEGTTKYSENFSDLISFTLAFSTSSAIYSSPLHQPSTLSSILHAS